MESLLDVVFSKIDYYVIGHFGSTVGKVRPILMVVFTARWIFAFEAAWERHGLENQMLSYLNDLTQDRDGLLCILPPPGILHPKSLRF